MSFSLVTHNHHKRFPYKREEFPEGNKLGIWCQRQRDTFKSKTLNKRKAFLLNNLYFEWYPVTNLWDKQLKNLIGFKALFSGRWPSQREEYPRQYCSLVVF